MLVLRSPLIIGAAPAGLLLAAAGWLLLGGADQAQNSLADLQTRLNGLPVPAARSAGVDPPLAEALARPAFVASAQATIRLDGLARMPGRAAALIAVNGGPAQWVALGDTLAGVTVTDVGVSRVGVEDDQGSRVILLGQTSQPGGAPSQPVGMGGDTPPPGFRLAPEPASAPASR